MRRIFDAEKFSQLVNYPLLADCWIAFDVLLIKHLSQLPSQLREAFASKVRACLKAFLITVASAFIVFVFAHFHSTLIMDICVNRRDFYTLRFCRRIEIFKDASF